MLLKFLLNIDVENMSILDMLAAPMDFKNLFSFRPRMLNGNNHNQPS